MHSIVTTFKEAVIKVEVANFGAAIDTLIDHIGAAIDTLIDQDVYDLAMWTKSTIPPAYNI